MFHSQGTPLKRKQMVAVRGQQRNQKPDLPAVRSGHVLDHAASMWVPEQGAAVALRALSSGVVAAGDVGTARFG